MRLAWLSCLSVALLAALPACKFFTTSCTDADRAPGAPTGTLCNPLVAEGVGGTCTGDAECRPGLYCVSRACKAKGDTPTNKACRLTAECGDKDYCGSQRVCKPAGTAALNVTCQNTSNCLHGN